MPGIGNADDSEVSHICAAARGGPRYDPGQSVEDRKSIDNAIFLCKEHAKMIDTHPDHYSAEMLAQMKKERIEHIEKKLWPHVSSSLKQANNDIKCNFRRAQNTVSNLRSTVESLERRLAEANEKLAGAEAEADKASKFEKDVLEQLAYQAKMSML